MSPPDPNDSSASGKQPSTGRPSRIAWVGTRRIAQTVSLALFLLLVLSVRDLADSPVPSGSYIQTDPLVATLVSIANRTPMTSLIGALVLALSAVVLGRFFCGWLCPLGTLLDVLGRFRPFPDSVRGLHHERLRLLKYSVLGLMVAGAALSAQWAHFADPMTILHRGIASSVLVSGKGSLAEPSTGMTFNLVALLLVVVVLASTLLTRRFFCRYLCPLGALYALLSRFSLLSVEVRSCGGCTPGTGLRRCVSDCRMGAIVPGASRARNAECIRCMTCVEQCNTGAVRLRGAVPFTAPGPTPALPERRAFLVQAAGAATLLPMAILTRSSDRVDPTVLRPPQVFDEDIFVDSCVRCGLCIRACPTGALRPATLATGLAGLWTPMLVPFHGGCVATCNACSRACPTQAIPRFTVARKWSRKMGSVEYEPLRCASQLSQVTCLKCADACPTGAINLAPGGPWGVKMPVSVDGSKCTGCGLCENACRKMVQGRPALCTVVSGRGDPVEIPAARNCLISPDCRLPTDPER